MQTEFNKEEEYIFVGNKNNYYPIKMENIEKDDVGNIILGKFLHYKDVYLHGDILSDAKAVFDYGTVDCGQYHNIIKKG